MGKLKELYNKIKVNRNKNSLRIQIFLYTILTLTIFIAGFEIFTYISLKNYYFNNVTALMYSQAKYNAELYLSNFSDTSLSDNIMNERLQFIRNADGQVQILDNGGKVIYDNMASSQIGELVTTPDVVAALGSEPSSHVIRHEDKNENVMAYSYPLWDNNSQVGVIRLIASLTNVEKSIRSKFVIFIIFGVGALLIGLIIAYYTAKSILKPVNKLTEVAEKLSDGQYEVKTNIDYVGEIGELAKTMDIMSENIIKKEEVKTDFISSVSHELRTPLTSIKGWSLTLQDESINQEMLLDGLRIIEKESDRLSDMVEDLLDFSRFTSPRFSLNKTSFNMVEIADNMINQLKPRTDDKDINLLLNYDHEDIVVIADENRMKQVLLNLLDNAIKFTPIGGTIVLNIRDEGDHILGEVIDTGIGISEEDIDLVTTKFFKGTSSESHTGLGLSICEEIIKEHKGTLEIQSVENEGTTIRFTIPKGESL